LRHTLGGQVDPVVGTLVLKLVDSGEVTAVLEADTRLR
jgi:hypothetical protein